MGERTSLIKIFADFFESFIGAGANKNELSSEERKTLKKLKEADNTAEFETKLGTESKKEKMRKELEVENRGDTKPEGTKETITKGENNEMEMEI